MKYDPLAYKIGDELKHKDTGDRLTIAGESRTITVRAATASQPGEYMPYWPALIYPNAINHPRERYEIVSAHELMMKWQDAVPDRGAGYYRDVRLLLGAGNDLSWKTKDPGEGWIKVRVADYTEKDFEQQDIEAKLSKGLVTMQEAVQMYGGGMTRDKAQGILDAVQKTADGVSLGNDAAIADGIEASARPLGAQIAEKSRKEAEGSGSVPGDHWSAFRVAFPCGVPAQLARLPKSYKAEVLEFVSPDGPATPEELAEANRFYDTHDSITGEPLRDAGHPDGSCPDCGV